MADKILVNILNTADYLSKVEFGLLFSNLIVLDKIVQLSLGGKLHDNKNIVSCV